METPGVDIEKLPFAQKPKYQHGVAVYRSLQDAITSGKFYDNFTGLPKYAGLTSSKGDLLPFRRINTQEKYIGTVRDFMQDNSTLYSRATSSTERDVKKENLPTQDWANIRIQMSGYGAAALQAGDIRTALLAFEVAGALRAAIAKGGQPISSVYLQTMIEIKDRKRRRNLLPEVPSKTPIKLVERPKASSFPAEPETILRSMYKPAEPLVPFDLVHSGKSDIYYVGPKDTATRIIKFPKDSDGYNRLFYEIDCLKKAAAKGLSVYPRLTLVMETPAHYVGVEMERIRGESLRDLKPKELTPERFGLSNRLWLLYDLIDSYKATDFIHGDLFSIDSFLREKQEGDWVVKLDMNLDNLILEDGTNRLRLIDPLAGPNNSTSYLLGVRAELEGMIEFLFRGRAKSVNDTSETSLPSNRKIMIVGINMADNLKKVTSLDQLYSIIPPEYRLPVEKH